MRKYVNGQYLDITPEEVAQSKKYQAIHRAEEKETLLSLTEVNQMLIAQQINTLSVDDNLAYRMRNYYPEWEIDVAYAVGFKVKRNGGLYRAITAHTSQSDWTPEATPSLWVQINVTHAGTEEDPIPYKGNMILEKGKYYTQNGEMYLCIRDTGNPVYHALSELVGLYVKIV